MRVWDIDVSRLCNKHLVAQHHEIHCIAGIFKKELEGQENIGFQHHPEVRRWLDDEFNTLALADAHDETVLEMLMRDMKHDYDADSSGIHDWFGGTDRPAPWQPVAKQVEILRNKGCGCNLEGL